MIKFFKNRLALYLINRYLKRKIKEFKTQYEREVFYDDITDYWEIECRQRYIKRVGKINQKYSTI